MKLFSLAILGISLSFASFNEAKNSDLEAFRVIEKRTSMNGIYYAYEIKNSGETMILGGSYKLFFRVNGKKISFDKATLDIKPGQTIKYQSQKTFYQKNDKNLNYSLEIEYNDSDIANNILTGQSLFNSEYHK
jgi:hypothetical protein